MFTKYAEQNIYVKRIMNFMFITKIMNQSLN